MPAPHILRVAALVDLPRKDGSGGHVKCWERLAMAAAVSDLPFDLTVYFSGNAPDEPLSKNVRLRHLPPVFSTARLKFLPYMPDTTDLSPWHPRLAAELGAYDVMHTTDGFFAFAQTAAKICAQKSIALTTSLHTDTPSYTRLFTRETIESLTGFWPYLTNKLLREWQIPEKQGLAMDKKLAAHIRAARYAFYSRTEDQELAESLIDPLRVRPLRLGIDKKCFGPHRADRQGVLTQYGIAANRVLALFVGRVDVGKNIYTLIDAAERCLAAGVPLHVLIAGVGPAENDVKTRLGQHATLLGYVKPDDLARLYASVDVLTLTSEVEIRSMVGGEALVSGCPVLVSEKSGIAPLYENTPAMRVVRGNGPGWAEALSTFASDKGLRDLMRMAALNYAAGRLPDWGDVVREDLYPVWLRAYEETLQQAA